VSPTVNFDVLCFVLNLLKMQEFKMMALKKEKNRGIYLTCGLLLKNESVI